MKSNRVLWGLALLLSLACASRAPAPAPTETVEVESAEPPPNASSELTGTSWQLVEFVGGDESRLTPDDKAKYTLHFEQDGQLSARIDCNRGRSSWLSSGPNQLEFGALAITRVACPPASLHDRLVRDWQYVRSYVIRDGHLFVALMADAGIYEFEPLESSN